MNADLNLLKVLITKDLIDPKINFRKFIKKDVIPDEAKGLLKAYFSIEEGNTSERDKKRLTTSIKKAVSVDITAGKISTIHFYIVDKHYADAITLYRTLPPKRLEKIYDYLKITMEAGQETIDFTFIERDTKLWDLIRPTDKQRYGFAFKIKPEADKEIIKNNLKEFKRLRDDVGITNPDPDNYELFKSNFCEIYDDIAYDDLKPQEIREKIEEKLKPVTRSR